MSEPSDTTATSAPSDLAHPKELAKFYGVSVPTFLTWFRHGVFPAALAIGTIYRFDREEVAKAIAKHTAKENRKRANRAN